MVLQVVGTHVTCYPVNNNQWWKQTLASLNFYNPGEGPYDGLLLVENSHYCFHIKDMVLNGHRK